MLNVKSTSWPIPLPSLMASTPLILQFTLNLMENNVMNRCGSTDLTMCSPDPKSSGKYICTVPVNIVGQTMEPSSSSSSSSTLCEGQIETIVPPSLLTNEQDSKNALYPFTCRLCEEKFNAQKALDVHSHTCPKQVGSNR